MRQEHPQTISFLPRRELIGIAPRDRFCAMTRASQTARAEKSCHSHLLLGISIHANSREMLMEQKWLLHLLLSERHFRSATLHQIDICHYEGLERMASF